MALDFDAMAIALALRYDPANVVPPAGFTNIQSSSAYGPPAAAQLPLVVVNPPDEGSMTFGGQERAGLHIFTVDFYAENLADPARIAEGVTKWLSVLVDQLIIAGAQLGGSVALAWTGRYTTGQMEIGGQELNGITLYVAVTTTDGISPVA